MDRRFSRDSSMDKKRSLTNQTSLQKQMAENRRPIRPEPKPEPVPDVADLMDEWFFGSNIITKKDNKANNNSQMITSNGGGGGGFMDDYDEEITVPSSPSRSNNSRLTQEWLQEAKRMVASSPARGDSPSRLVGSPRFASAGSKDLDRRDPLSRSARRHRAVESFSGEILTKSAKHGRNRSETFESQPATDTSPASVVHQWFSNILKPHNNNNNNNTSSEPKHQNHQDSSEDEQPDSPHPKPPKPMIRKSRFRDIPNETQKPGQPNPSKRTFRNPSALVDNQLLSPPKNLIESAHRRSVSSSTCSLSDKQIISPPKNLIESVHKRSISSSTCSMDKVSIRPDTNGNLKDTGGDGARDLNVFLKEQKFKLRRISNGEFDAKARIILSGSSNSTSSMVAAICYAWFLANRNKKEDNGGSFTVVAPVMNMKRRTMWKQKQAAWLFHHVGIDSSAVLFSDEVDLEFLMIKQQLSMQVIGQDALKTNGEVGSQCTILTDNYCEDAYDLLQIPILKKLLLAGIMLDTQNLNSSANFYTNRDAEAVQLLLVGSTPNYRNALFDQLMQDQRDGSFEQVLQQKYGKPPNESDGENGEAVLLEQNMVSAGRRSTSINESQGTITHNLDKMNPKNTKISPKSVLASAPQTPARAPENRGKNKFFLAKWFGFGSK